VLVLLTGKEFSDHDGTYVTIGCGFNNNKNYKHKIWGYKRADYLLMKQKISEIDNYLCDYQSVSVY
jgi:hypothetical protein